MVDTSNMRYIYAVQISKVSDCKIVTDKYSFTSKADAIKWAAKYTKPKQYATIVKMPNWNYVNASRYVRSISKRSIAYEKGTSVGILRLLNGVPVVVSENYDDMYLVTASGRLGKKMKSVWKDPVFDLRPNVQ